MARGPQSALPTPQPAGRDDAIAVISAYGAFRVLLALLAVWTFFAGFSLLTQGIGALSFGGDDASERVIGAYMIVLVPIYGLLVWRREEYRLLLWVPYAAQIAIILPTLWDLLRGNQDFGDSALLLVVSIIFFVLLAYLWRASHPVGFFDLGGDEEEEEDEDEEPDMDEFGDDEDEVEPPRLPPSGPATRLPPV
ncbi:MAG: hypothetical protein WEC75_01440 [Dehalococcoidia bacterium]